MYEIKITTTREVMKHAGREWVVVSQGEDGKSEYGYTPAIEKPATETIELFSQTVEELDLISVVLAVNGILKVQRPLVIPTEK